MPETSSGGRRDNGPALAVETVIAPSAAARVSPHQRYHSLDSLRAAMMFLGIWMHGVQCYTCLKVYLWPFKDTARSQLFDFTVNWVHMFRMPVFYAMAGFFFALLATRRGFAAALTNRGQRILLPFLLGWAVLAPILVATITYLRDRSWPAALAAATTGATYWKAGPLHLWFLEYLLLFYPVILGADWLVRRVLGAGGLHVVTSLFRRVLRSRGRALFMALVTVGPQARMGGWLTTPTAFEPDPRIFITYLLFFGFGWVLYFERDLLEEIKSGGWAAMLLGGAVTVLGYMVLIGVVPERIWLFAGPLTTWLLVFGFMSLFLRYLDRPIGWIRYLADSSYWLYLLHVPLLIWIQVLLAPLPLPALFKGLLALAISVPLLLLSYQFGVRHTWVGVLLNGRRQAPGQLLRSSPSHQSL